MIASDVAPKSSGCNSSVHLCLKLTCTRTIVDVKNFGRDRSEEHTSELQSLRHLVCRLLFEKKKKVWIATQRSRARGCVVACVYGPLDFVGYPRFPSTVEFIADVIEYYVQPVNIHMACLIMECAELTEDIIKGVERRVKAAELLAFTLRVRAGNTVIFSYMVESARQSTLFPYTTLFR